jgi:hypothetical protein
MKEYYVIEILSGPPKLVKLGERLEDVEYLEDVFAKYNIEKLLIGEHPRSYTQYNRLIEVRLNKILRFKDDETALLWYKLNY